MVGSQVLVYRKNNWHPEAATQTRVQHPEKLLGRSFPEHGCWEFGWRDLAWILGDREKRAEKSTRNPRQLLELRK